MPAFHLSGALWRVLRRVLLTFGVLGLLGAAAAAPAADSLKLISVNSDGIVSEGFKVEGAAVMVQSGAASKIMSQSAHWELAGNPAENGHLFHWSPPYGLKRERHYPTNVESFPFRSSVGIFIGEHSGWPLSSLRSALIVFGWMKDGVLVRLSVVPFVHPKLDVKDSIADVEFLLSAEEAAGFPFVLVWRDGAFIPPIPPFKDPDANRLLTLMHLSPSEDAAVALVEQRPELTKMRDGGNIALVDIAAESGRLRTMRALLNADRSIRGKDSNLSGLTLQWATNNKRTDIVTELLGRGTAFWSDLEWSLPLAIREGYGEIADAITERLSKPGRPFRSSEFARFALDADQPNRAEVLAGGSKSLAALPATALQAQAEKQNYASIIYLLSLGISPTKLPDKGAYLVRAAVRDGQHDALDKLLIAGAAPDPRAKTIRSALAEAVRQSDRAAVKRLLAAGANPQYRDTSGYTPLQSSVFSGDSELSLDLLRASASFVNQERGARSTLHLALLSRHRVLAEKLAAGDARLDLSAENGLLALKAAVAMDLWPLVERALHDGWKIDQDLETGWNLAALAQAYSAVSVSTMLASRGAKSPSGFIEVGNLESLPKALVLSVSPDVRSPDQAWPESLVRVEGIVAADGRFLHSQVIGCDDLELVRGLLEASTDWQFSPATSRGKPVESRLAVPIHFPPQERKVFTNDCVDVRPIQLLPEWEPLPEAGFYLSNIDVARATPGMKTLLLFSIYEIGTDIAYVRCTIGKDGSPRDVKILGLPARKWKEQAITEAMKRRFVPATREGVPVECEMDLAFKLPM